MTAPGMSGRPCMFDSPYPADKALRAYPPGILDRTPAVRHDLRLTLAAVAREQYPTPVPTCTFEELERYLHADIRWMDDETLDDERFLARQRRACDPADAWTRERFDRLTAEAARRHGRSPRQERGR